MLETSDPLRERLTTLRSVSRALARPLDIVGALRAIHTELARAVDITICFFGWYDAPGQTVEVVWQIHNGVELPGGSFPVGSGATSLAIRECRPVLIRRWSVEGPSVKLEYATDRPGLPESSIVVPVLFDGEIVGVLAVQSYRPEAYDNDDVALIQAVADQAAVAVVRSRQASNGSTGADAQATALEAVLASMPDGLLVLDDEARVVRLNQAARQLLSTVDGSVILGQPVDRPQADRWPLGNRAVTEQLLPLVDQLKRGASPREEIELALDGGADHKVACRAAVLFKDGSPAGGLMVLRAVSR